MNYHESANIIGTETAPEFHPRNGLESQPPLVVCEFMGPFTLPETNSSHLKIDGRYGRCNFLLGFGLFSDEICLFQEK